MGQKQQSVPDPVDEPKKKRRVGFSKIDAGIDAKDCIKIYLVSSKEDVGAKDSLCIDPVDLNSFFDEDEKIYGYQGLKITVWFSILSFHSHAEITYQSTSDGGKGITDLKSILQRIFAETLVDNKEEFLQTFSTESNFIGSIVSNGKVLKQRTSNGHANDSNRQLGAASSDLEVIRLVAGNMATGLLYSRMIPLVLLLVDGSSPIDVSDPQWELYLLIQRKSIQQGDIYSRLLGFAALYRFYHYPDGSRLRLSQILVLPNYQHKGYGHKLLEVLNDVAISENVYDFTIEEPLELLQHIRTCIDIKRLLGFDSIKEAINSAVSQLKQGKLSKKTRTPRFVPPPSATEEVRKHLKITKKQFFQCWEILIYLGLHPVEKYIEDFVSVVSARMRDEIIGKDSDTLGKKMIEVPSDYEPEMSFVLFQSHGTESSVVQMDESQSNQEEQLRQLVEERVKEIKLIAQKVSADCVESIAVPANSSV